MKQYFSFPKFFIIFFFIGIGSLYSQEKTSEKDSMVVETAQLPQKTIQVTNTITTQEPISDFSAPVVNTITKDSLIFDLQDHPIAKTADSLWMQELFSASLFNKLYNDITNKTYEEVEYKELPTDTLKKRLEALNARTPFNVEYNPSLEKVIKHYLKNRRKSLTKLMALSEYYFPLFEQELDKHNLPLEIKYLAIVESALNPTAQSRVGAKGLWQFMFTTGKHFGLEVSSYVDERANPERSTEAASKYLKSLYRSFNDWDLALAAYNSGPGNVSKAIRRSGGEINYWKLRDYLPKETAGYVPAFLATMYIFEYAEEHGLKNNGPKYHQLATDTVRVKKLITLEQVAKVTNLSLAEVEFLNPSYKLGIIPVIEGKNYAVRLPVEAIGKFVANEEAIYAFAEEEIKKREKPLPKYTDQQSKIRYRVRSGDYLGKIAKKYGVKVSQIKRWNGLKNNSLRIGQRLTIYPRNFHNSSSKSTKSGIAKTNSKGSSKIYTVKSGDSLWSISQKFPGVTIENIKKWNDISGSKLKPGMKLKVSKG